MTLRERIRAIKGEAIDLEAQAVEQDRVASLVEALRSERAGQQQRRDAGLRLGDRLEHVPDPAVPGGLKPGERTGNELAEKAATRISAIDAEIDRVQKTG